MNSVVSIDLEEFVTSEVSTRGKQLAVGSLRAFVILQSFQTGLVGRALMLDLVIACIGSLFLQRSIPTFKV